jgi:hypothetical protein
MFGFANVVVAEKRVENHLQSTLSSFLHALPIHNRCL